MVAAERPAVPPANSKPLRVVVASLGNEYRRDDGAGQVVASGAAERLSGVRNAGPQVDPLALLGTWDESDLAIVIDATRGAGTPGEVRVVDLATTDEHPGATSTHGISLSGALRLARAVGRAPARVVVVGIEGDDFGKGKGLSPSVAAAVPSAIGKVVQFIEEAQGCA